MTTGRLAPTPSGFLHLGNARSFLLAWLWARSLGGRVVMRIEDIDLPRCSRELRDQALEDIAWLGLDWDEGPHAGDAIGPYDQSTRFEHYRRSLDKLVQARRAYPCVCSRKDIEEASRAPHGDEGAVYPGTCRGRFASLAQARQATGREPALRFRVDAEAVPFVDGFAGEQPGLVRGDFVVQKRDGGPAYQLAVVVDDAGQGVTEVLRADDLLPSTPRQLLLYRALGLREPSFVHVPLVVGVDGLRLAKRHGDTSLRWFRQQGVTAQALVGHLAFLLGLRPRGVPCLPHELLRDFAWAAVPRGPVCGSDHGLSPA